MGCGPLVAAESRTSLGCPSMGTPRRRLAHEAGALGARLAIEAPRIRAGLDDQGDDDCDECHADEFAAVLERGVRPHKSSGGIARSQPNTQRPMNLGMDAEK